MTSRPWRTSTGALAAVSLLLLATGCDGTDASAGAGSADEHVSAVVGEFCAPYVDMRQSLAGLDFDRDSDAVAGEVAPVLRRWAQQLPGLDRPPGIADEVWAGLQLLAKRVRRLPARPTHRQLRAVEGYLTDDEHRLITGAKDWFAANCDLGATDPASSW